MKLAQSNIAKTYLYMALLVGLVGFATHGVSTSLGYGSEGVWIGLLIGSLLNFISYYFSDRIVLMQSGGQKVDRKTVPQLYKVAEQLSKKVGIPVPKLYIIPDESLNAFATGRDPTHASVAVTAGLLAHLSADELEGVVAHELAHIKNYDTRLMSAVSILVGFLSMLSHILWRSHAYESSSDRQRGGAGSFNLLFLLITPIVGILIQFAISRQREYVADATGAKMAGSSRGLVNALLKLERGAAIPLATADMSTSHLYITNPFGTQSVFFTLFSTHPPISERIGALQQLSI